MEILPTLAVSVIALAVSLKTIAHKGAFLFVHLSLATGRILSTSIVFILARLPILHQTTAIVYVFKTVQTTPLETIMLEYVLKFAIITIGLITQHSFALIGVLVHPICLLTTSLRAASTIVLRELTGLPLLTVLQEDASLSVLLATLARILLKHAWISAQIIPMPIQLSESAFLTVLCVLITTRRAV
jgi:hypothetical protein